MTRPDDPAPDESAGRLAGVRRVPHDEDERQSREDISYGETIFNRSVVPLPRFLTRRRKKKKKVTSRNPDA
jgi:hypothetical protein